MSKSLGNIVQPNEVIEKYSRDYLRYYLTLVSRGEDMSFDWKAFEEIHKFFNIFLNSYSFSKMYLQSKIVENLSQKDYEELSSEDRWIISRLYSVVLACDKGYSSYKFFEAMQAIDEFVIEDFSRTYIKIIKNRLDDAKEKERISLVINHVITVLLKILSPITPHLSEFIYQDLKQPSEVESVHLLKFPELKDAFIDLELEKEMINAKKAIEKTLMLRESKKIRLRWALNNLFFIAEKDPFPNLKEFIRKAMNVKNVEHLQTKVVGDIIEDSFNGTIIQLDVQTLGLEEKWIYSELRRKIQDLRKKAKLIPKDKVKVLIDGDKEFIEKIKTELESETNSIIEIGPSNVPKEKLVSKAFGIEVKA